MEGEEILEGMKAKLVLEEEAAGVKRGSGGGRGGGLEGSRVDGDG